MTWNSGVGRKLIAQLASYVAEHGLAGITLSANRFALAPDFYRRPGFSDCSHVLFMAKEVSHGKD